jgi:integrase
MALTVKQVAKATEPGRYGDGDGLYLQVTVTKPKGGKPRKRQPSRVWVLRYETAGRIRWMGLGSLATLTPAEARERARKARQLVKDGIDPIDARKFERTSRATEQAAATAKAVSFVQAAEDYFAFHAPQWKNVKHARQFLSTLKTYAYPVIGRLPVGVIDKALVLQVLRPIWHAKNETASRVRGRIENVLDFAKVNGWRDGDNPAAWPGNLEHALPAPTAIQKVQHHAALPYSETPEFIAGLRKREGTAAAALEFTILTAARTSEVIGARWDEFELRAVPVTIRDEEGKESTVMGPCWTVPADRIKGGKLHRVPLTDRVVRLLKAVPREKDNPFVFIGPSKGRGLSNAAMSAVLERMGRTDITVHGFRSSFRDWAAETTTHANFVVEMALAHVIDSKAEKAYRRGDLFDKRRLLMTDWMRFCGSPKRSGASTVVALRSKAK